MERQIHLTDKEKSYNQICGITMTNIYTITKNCETIPFWQIDVNDDEHLYVLSVGVALAGAIGKKVSAWGTRRFVRKLNKKLGLKKECRITRMDTKDTMFAVQPGMLNNDLREIAKEKCGENFTFADIYHEFYERKKK